MSVTHEIQDGVAEVTMRWPGARNALGPDDALEIRDALDAAYEAGAEILILTGEGAFCAGGNLPVIAAAIEGKTAEEVGEVVYERFQGVIRALRDAPIPTIAAVDGPAVGLGMDIALTCDMRLVGEQGSMRQGWAMIGVLSGTGGAAAIERIAPGVGWRLIAEQPVLDGAECERLGLGEAVEGSALDAARDRARRLLRMPATARAGYVELIRPVHAIDDETLARCARIQGELLASERFLDLAASFGHAGRGDGR
jgi:enoyl-CoA hydratase/carnithine racemase